MTWAPTFAQAARLATGDAVVEWSAALGWRVVPRPRGETATAATGSNVETPVVSAPRALTPAEVRRRWPRAARRAGLA